MRNEEDPRWQARWPFINIEEGREEIIINVDGDKLLKVLTAMNLLHMNDATRAMLRDKYPDIYRRLIETEYADAEKRLLVLLKKES